MRMAFSVWIYTTGAMCPEIVWWTKTTGVHANAVSFSLVCIKLVSQSGNWYGVFAARLFICCPYYLWQCSGQHCMLVGNWKAHPWITKMPAREGRNFQCHPLTFIASNTMTRTDKSFDHCLLSHCGPFRVSNVDVLSFVDTKPESSCELYRPDDLLWKLSFVQESPTSDRCDVPVSLWPDRVTHTNGSSSVTTGNWKETWKSENRAEAVEQRIKGVNNRRVGQVENKAMNWGEKGCVILKSTGMVFQIEPTRIVFRSELDVPYGCVHLKRQQLHRKLVLVRLSGPTIGLCRIFSQRGVTVTSTVIKVARSQKGVVCSAFCASWSQEDGDRNWLNRLQTASDTRWRSNRPTLTHSSFHPNTPPSCPPPCNVWFFWVSRQVSFILAQ